MAARVRASALFLILTLGCSGSPTQPAPLPLGEPFEVRLGAPATLANDLVLLFSEVRSDSRCPLDATCVRAGEAIVRVSLAKRTTDAPPASIVLFGISSGVAPACDEGGSRRYCLLSTAEGKNIAEAGEHTIRLVRLTPHPRAATPIQPGEYSATFVVSPR